MIHGKANRVEGFGTAGSGDNYHLSIDPMQTVIVTAPASLTINVEGHAPTVTQTQRGFITIMGEPLSEVGGHAADAAKVEGNQTLQNALNAASAELSAAMLRLEANALDVKVACAPGYGLSKGLRLILPRKFFDQVVEAQHADALFDYYETLKAGDMSRARWVFVMTYVWMLWSVFGGLLSWAADKWRGSIGSAGD